MNNVLCIYMSPRENMKLMTLQIPAFSAYNTNMDLIHISDIENQISVKCVHIVIVHVCKLTYRVVLIWLENWSWATMAKANNTSMNYRILFVLWNINQNIMNLHAWEFWIIVG